MNDQHGTLIRRIGTHSITRAFLLQVWFDRLPDVLIWLSCDTARFTRPLQFKGTTN